MSIRQPSRNSQAGTALLAVLWLTAALSAIAFSVADTVRTEAERSVSAQDSIRAYYLARGGLERAMVVLRDPSKQRPTNNPIEMYNTGRRRIYTRFPGGDVIVEIISEQGKLNFRSANPVLLQRLLLALGESPESANSIAAQLRRGAGGMPAGQFVAQNSASASTFQVPTASLENVEELMLLPGISAELLYGRYSRQADGQLVELGGLMDCLSAFGSNSSFDFNSIHPALMQALGMSPATALAIAKLRHRSPLEGAAFQAALRLAGPQAAFLNNDLGSVFQVRATARPRMANGRLSPVRRTVSLLLAVSAGAIYYQDPITQLRWFDTAFSDVGASDEAWMEPLPIPAVSSTLLPGAQQ
jgi:general secretion pathway protein K